MLYFIDESGSFVTHGEQPVPAVFATVVIPETSLDEVSHAFNNFVLGLPAAEKGNGEAKGHLLSNASRHLFAEFLNAFPDIMVHTTVLDLELSDEEVLESGRKQFGEMIREQAKNYMFPEMRNEVETLGRQVRNLGHGQLAQIYSLAQEIVGVTNSSIVKFSARRFEHCFRRLCFEIDAVSRRQDLVFRKLLSLWLPAWSERSPIPLIQGIHEPGHPLVDNFQGPHGSMDARKLIVDNLHFVDSKCSLGVQMADVVANCMLQAVRDPHDSQGHHSVVGRILRNSCSRRDNPMGLTALKEEHSSIRSSKYRNLMSAIIEEKQRALASTRGLSDGWLR